MVNPLVTVICLCYNHERFVREALESVFHQTYPNIEIIVVDDASTDGSRDVIKKTVAGHSGVKVHFLKKNLGICGAFNVGWRLATGKFIVDFSTDDVLLPERIEKQVMYFQTEGKRHGVVFTDAIYIDEHGMEVRRHFDYLRKHKLVDKVPEGDVYPEVVERFFISAPTMLVRREVMDALDGYDETLAYEDFDFWVRSSRKFSYGFLNEFLTKVRVSSGSLSRKVYTAHDRQAHSTYLICRKIARLNRNEREAEALRKRLRYELRHCVLTGNAKEAELFYRLLAESGGTDLFSTMLIRLNTLGIPLSWLRRVYHRLKYR